MKKLLTIAAVGLFVVAGFAAVMPGNSTEATSVQQRDVVRPGIWSPRFELDVLVNGQPIAEYHARGRTYVEAIAGSEYEIRIRNPLPYRVAVSLSVDGLNTIDARRTTAWNASKWVIEPYGTIHVGGWQMSSVRARRFYFTSERDSYAAKLGQTSNLGLISAVIFRERHSTPVPVVPPPPSPRDRSYKEENRSDSGEAPMSSQGRTEGLAKQRQGTIAPVPDDDYAATGIGRSVHNDVRWINMELDSRPAAELTIRYEFYPALVRLGIIPQPYPRPDTLGRREHATGFDNRRFSPEP